MIILVLSTLPAAADDIQIKIPDDATGITHDGESIWFTSRKNRTLYRISNELKISPFKLNLPGLGDLDYDAGAATLLVSSGNLILFVHPFNGKTMKKLRVGMAGISGIAADKSVIFLLDNNEKLIRFYDKQSGLLTGGINIEEENLSGLYFDNEYLWSCGKDGMIVKIDPGSGKTAGAYNTGFPGITGLVIFQDTIYLIDPEQNRIHKIKTANQDSLIPRS